MPPITKLGFYKRKAGTTHEQWAKHWEEVHGPLIANFPGIEKWILRYVQHQLSPIEGSKVPDETYDGFSEVTWRDEDARDELYAAGFREVVIPDEEKFLDMEATRWLVVDTQVTQIGEDVFAGLSKKQ